jgi:hypothetical protein
VAKPNVAAIRAAQPLSALPTCGADPITVCNICGKSCEQLALWREHDERDKPTKKLVFIGTSPEHADCRKVMEKHPRLYADDRGMPGYFPLLCGPCVHRQGWRCTHADLKANGGAGLKVSLAGVNAILCGPGGCRSGLREATACVGRKVAASSEASP